MGLKRRGVENASFYVNTSYRKDLDREAEHGG
jgi:hypothetical protein